MIFLITKIKSFFKKKWSFFSYKKKIVTKKNNLDVVFRQPLPKASELVPSSFL